MHTTTETYRKRGKNSIMRYTEARSVLGLYFLLFVFESPYKSTETVAACTGPARVYTRWDPGAGRGGHMPPSLTHIRYPFDSFL